MYEEEKAIDGDKESVAHKRRDVVDSSVGERTGAESAAIVVVDLRHCRYHLGRILTNGNWEVEK